jgi:hypothetical protein
MFNHLAQYAPE